VDEEGACSAIGIADILNERVEGDAAGVHEVFDARPSSGSVRENSSRAESETSAAKQSAEKLDFEFDFGWRSGSPLR
jgi:hypothetical protein